MRADSRADVQRLHRMLGELMTKRTGEIVNEKPDPRLILKAKTEMLEALKDRLAIAEEGRKLASLRFDDEISGTTEAIERLEVEIKADEKDVERMKAEAVEAAREEAASARVRPAARPRRRPK